jgi:YVTN family beta-propeller protein
LVVDTAFLVFAREIAPMARCLTLVAGIAWLLGFCSPATAEQPRYPGPTDKGFLLPNGWTISPAGQQVTLTDLPVNIAPLPDGKHALVATGGFNRHELSLIDLTTSKVVARESVRNSWFGLALTTAGDKVWWSGGGADLLHTFDLKAGQLIRTSQREPYPEKLTRQDLEKLRKETAKQHHFKSGLTLDVNRQRLYTLDINAGTITALDLKDGTAGQPAPCGRRPYDVAVARDGTLLYVSDWASRTVLVVSPDDLRIMAKIAVGEHPNQLALHPRDDRLFVACASTGCVSVIDTKRGVVTETIMTAIFPRAPEGSTPDAVTVAPDGQTLYVANADNNCVAVIDVSRPSRSQVKGFIPTGWYPTAIAVAPNGRQLLVGVGKGNQTRANPLFKDKPPKDDLMRKLLPYPYIGTTLSGALSIVPVPDDKQLAAYTATVYRNCPYSDKLLEGTPYPQKTAIPTRVGDPSPIKHVLYIIKENRTYDQVFGDMGRGNCDPTLVMFGAKITPNHHKLADEFVLLDNLYCNGQVSRDGHPWSTMAYNTDYIARDWHLTYSARKGVEDDEEANLEKAPSGYLWDACARHGLSYRNYGEYGRRVSQKDGTFKMEAAVPGLVGHMCPDYGVSEAKGRPQRDTDNVEVFLKEFRRFEQDGNLPRLMIMSLGEDHTSGTKPGAFTPEAAVASNDLALGRLVDAVSRSKYWPQMAIFVIEDDAQNGPDHVDAHRTVGLVISPYVKRHALDSTQYSTVSMLRTIELILGLPPLSQYDAAARPMYAAFSDRPDLTPYRHVGPQTDLNAINPKTAYGAERSARMDFSEYDRVDDFELNEILWRAIKGRNAPLPPAVRRAIAQRPVP